MLKALIEKRNAKLAELQAITNKAATEVRALTDEENAQFEAIEAEIRALDDTIAKAQEQRAALEVASNSDNGDGTEDQETAEVRAMANYIRGQAGVETRDGAAAPSDVNLVPSTNGAVIPKTIASRIVKKIYEISPILERATKYTVKGTLVLPYYDDESGAITVEYATEFTDGTSTVGSFDKIELNGFLARSLTKVSRSLMNNTDVELVAFVVNDMGEQIARWLERELLLGTPGKITGLSNCSNTITAASGTAITLDELIDLQDSIIDFYQPGAMWIMNRATRTAIRKLKDADGKPLLQQDVTAPFGQVLLGKPVYTSDSMPTMAAGNTAIYYGDFSGLAVKFAEDPNIQVLMEKYAEQHAIGVLGFVEVDADIQVAQAIAQLKMKAS